MLQLGPSFGEMATVVCLVIRSFARDRSAWVNHSGQPERCPDQAKPKLRSRRNPERRWAHAIDLAAPPGCGVRLPRVRLPGERRDGGGPEHPLSGL